LRAAIKAHWKQVCLATTPPQYDTIDLEELALFLDGEFLPAGIKHKDVMLGLDIRLGSLRSSEEMARAIELLESLKQLRHRRRLCIRLRMGYLESVIDIERFLNHFRDIYLALTETRSATFELSAVTEGNWSIMQESGIIRNYYEMELRSWREMYGLDVVVQVRSLSCK
jgi:hypothetical protein